MYTYQSIPHNVYQVEKVNQSFTIKKAWVYIKYIAHSIGLHYQHL